MYWIEGEREAAGLEGENISKRMKTQPESFKIERECRLEEGKDESYVDL